MNDFNVSMSNHHVSYELAKHMQAENSQRIAQENRAGSVNRANDRTRFLVLYHFRSLMYRFVPRIAARMML